MTITPVVFSHPESATVILYCYPVVCEDDSLKRVEVLVGGKAGCITKIIQSRFYGSEISARNVFPQTDLPGPLFNDLGTSVLFGMATIG